MKRVILSAFIFILAYAANGQTFNPINGNQRFTGRLAIPVKDTTGSFSGDSSQLVIRPQDGYLWYKYKGAWVASSGGPFDTTTISNRINLKVNISDTSSMLSGYAKSGQSVRYADTAAMLANRLKISDTATAFSGYARKNFSNVTGTLPVSNGGTGGTSYTANRVLFGNGTSAITTVSGISWDGTYFNAPNFLTGGQVNVGGGSGGSSKFFSNQSDSTFLSTDYDNLVFRAGVNNANRRAAYAYSGNTKVWYWDINGDFFLGKTLTGSETGNKVVTADWVLGKGYATTSALGSYLLISDTATMNNRSLKSTGTMQAAHILVSDGSQRGAYNPNNSNAGYINDYINWTEGGALYATTFNGTNIYGTVFTAAQPNITSLGTQTNLTVSGNTLLSKTGIPLTVNSTNSNGPKINLQDNGTLRGSIGASSNGVEAYNASNFMAASFGSINGGGGWFKLPIGVNGPIIGLTRSATAYNWYIGINSSGEKLTFYENGGSGVADINSSTGAYTALSDSTLKKNIIDAAPALPKLMQINVRQYDWKSTGTHEPYGVIAQELYNVLPAYVSKPADSTGKYGTQKAEMVPMVIKSVQEVYQMYLELKQQFESYKLAHQ